MCYATKSTDGRSYTSAAKSKLGISASLIQKDLTKLHQSIATLPTIDALPDIMALYIPDINTILATQEPITVFWFRRDLRLIDNHALYQALKRHSNVLPLYIFDQQALHHVHPPKDPRATFIYQTLTQLQQTLQGLGTSLLVASGKPLAIFERLTAACNITAIYANEGYEPYAIERDSTIRAFAKSLSISFYTYKDHVLFGKDDILKQDGSPYVVYSPYMKAWKKAYDQAQPVPSFDTTPYAEKWCKITCPWPSLQDLGFIPTQLDIPNLKLDEALLHAYADERNDPTKRSTTCIGIHLHLGTISIRQVTKMAYRHSQAWLNQLIWRNFYTMILAHFPHVVHEPFRPAYRHILWRNNEEEFQTWCQGKTGYPMVDAGIRELNATGWMHNRVRMVVASFLTKLLLIDWRWGEAFFAKKLLDYDLAANNGNWQWVTGCGCDAAPYPRIFNPYLQAQRFDPQGTYISKWVPEQHTNAYPKPMVDYTYARQRAIKIYTKALQSQQ